MLLLNQVVDVRNADLRRKARIDSAAAGAGAVKFWTGVVGINDVLRLHAQAFEIPVEQRRVGVNIEHARNTDAQVLAILHQRAALFRAFAPARPAAVGSGSATDLGVGGTEDFFGGDVDEIRMLIAESCRGQP